MISNMKQNFDFRMTIKFEKGVTVTDHAHAGMSTFSPTVTQHRSHDCRTNCIHKPSLVQKLYQKKFGTNPFKHFTRLHM